MANPFYNAINGQNAVNPAQMLAQLKSDPVGFLNRAGMNLPNGVNSPQEIIQYLMNNGRISQQQLNYAQQMAKRFGF